MSERALSAGWTSRLLALSRGAKLALAHVRAERRRTAATLTTASDRLERARAFYAVYEELIETLLGATNFGPGDANQRQYALAAAEMRERYPAVQPYLLAYLRMTSSDAEYGIRCEGRPLDAFEILFRSDRVADLLASDDGEMIHRIQRTREALTLYTEHLRTLVAARSPGT